MLETMEALLIKNDIITAFVFVALVIWLSYFLSDKLTMGRLHGSAVAITLGLVLAWAGVIATAEP